MNRDPSEIEAEVRTMLGALAANSDPAAFQALLGLSQYLGECLGLSPHPGPIPVVGRCRECRGHHQAGGLVEMAPLVAVPA